MNTTTILSTILSQFDGATMVRKSKQNFIAIPKGENEDGVMEYVKVAVSDLLSKPTKTNPAFDFDAAVAEYAEWSAEQAEKASKPKSEKKSGADPAKQAEKEKRKGALLAWLIENPGAHSCSEIFNAMPGVYAGKTFMTVGSDAKELVASGTVEKSSEQGKNYYSAV
jgi:hypothetical protein